MKILSCLIALFVGQSAFGAEVKPGAKVNEMERKVFGIEERELFANCFYLEYPLTYQVDHKGGIVPPSMRDRAGADKVEEGDLHTLILRDPSGVLEVRASSYGFIGDTGTKERGIKSPREVVLMDYVQNAATVTISEKGEMEMIRMNHGKVITVLFVEKDPEWNTNCLQSLSFILKDEEQYGNFEEEIERMISSFVPGFARK